MQLILVIMCGVLMGSVDTENTNYQYDKQGRHIIPSQEELDKLPKPSYHLIDFQSYAKSFNNRKSVDQPGAYPYARLITSRGCPEKCSFCQVPSLQGSYFRARTPDHVCDEIEWLKKEYGIKSVIFDDDNIIFIYIYI